MFFNSLSYLVFLPVVFTVFWISSISFRSIILLIASYIFYAFYNPWFTLLLLGTTLVDFYCSQKISDTQQSFKKKRWLLFSLLSNLGVLFFFKYSIFFYNSSISILNNFSGDEYSLLEYFIIPAGLSFYTFQSISYLVDVYRGHTKATNSFTEYALFVSFFPQLVAGPIERFNDLSPQLKANFNLRTLDFDLAFKKITWGFFKKIVIADRLADLVNPVMNDVHAFSGATYLVTGFLFAVQVYCDFSGYTDIATGSAKLFGINLCVNWRRPLLSKSVNDFWKRNHLSITTWFRDYLYFSLGGNRVSKSRWVFNIIFVFLISGLWHGANWTFLVWASLHAMFFLLEHFLKNKFSFSLPLLGVIYLLTFHSFSMLAFRASTLADLSQIYFSIFSNFDLLGILKDLNRISHVFPLVIAFSLIIILFLKEIQEEKNVIKLPLQLMRMVQSCFYIILIILIFLIGNFNTNEFIYFQF